MNDGMSQSVHGSVIKLSGLGAVHEGFSTPKLMREAHGAPCPYCGLVMMRGTRRHPSRDHLWPRVDGGKLYRGNVLIVCAPCNNKKGGKSLEAFAVWLQVKGDPRAARVQVVIEVLNSLRMGGREA